MKRSAAASSPRRRRRIWAPTSSRIIFMVGCFLKWSGGSIITSALTRSGRRIVRSSERIPPMLCPTTIAGAAPRPSRSAAASRGWRGGGRVGGGPRGPEALEERGGIAGVAGRVLDRRAHGGAEPAPVVIDRPVAGGGEQLGQRI